MSDASLLNQVWNMLAHHRKEPGHTPQRTLLRLLTQHCEMHFDWSLGWALQDDTLTATLEHRTTAELDKLWRVHERRAPVGPADLPIAVLRVGDTEFVIDGNTRINKLVAENAPGSHPVIVVEAKQVKWRPPPRSLRPSLLAKPDAPQELLHRPHAEL